jgi:hypothetical protein
MSSIVLPDGLRMLLRAWASVESCFSTNGCGVCGCLCQPHPTAHCTLSRVCVCADAGWDAGQSTAQFVVFTAVREEQPYIEEFVQYHLSIGVDLVYIYDNENHPTYAAMFPCHPRVRVVFFPWSSENAGVVFKVRPLPHHCRLLCRLSSD